MEKNVLVTGGCGFIGSHLVDLLVDQGFFVTVVDDLTANTTTDFLKKHLEENKASFYKYDIRNLDLLLSIPKEFEAIFHLAAQPDVKKSVENPEYDFSVNTMGTFTILELMRKKDIRKLVFAGSGGTVYGDTTTSPTPEVHPLRPISNYGAAKAAAEMYCSSYSSLYNLDIISLRLGNIYGPRSKHGVMYDFYHKLKTNPKELEILGDGNQTKSYLYIEDTIEAFNILYQSIKSGYDVFNVSSDIAIKVVDIADEIIKLLGIKNVKFSFTEGKRGWKGDVSFVSPDVTKLMKLGWVPRVSLSNGIKLYFEWLFQA
ncbi:MAG: GDP-mannose 4,6-dehydratase [Candidatus Heimdallarchaeota archaeon]|nr:GDP-mannose 4,6-dehydratase [Candidatus Heimdallarchaeota archaeon]MCK4770671.1 GDP-mannose 4,6-dehydratase [Candidatus Heimdallarchaeota archaeon]